MSIIEKLKDEVEAIGCPFFYQSQELINILLDNARFPACYAFLINSGNAIFENGRIRERIQVALFFVKPTEYDFESFENEAIIQLCKVKADRLVFALSQSSTLKLDAINNTQRLYDEYDCIVTGYGVNLTIEELEGVSTCDFPAPTITEYTYLPCAKRVSSSGVSKQYYCVEYNSGYLVGLGSNMPTPPVVGDILHSDNETVVGSTTKVYYLAGCTASTAAEFVDNLEYSAFNIWRQVDSSKKYRVKQVKIVPDTTHLMTTADYADLYILEEYCEC